MTETKRALGVLMVVPLVAALAACASRGQVDALDTRVDGLARDVTALKQEVAAMRGEAARAAEEARKAAEAAREAATAANAAYERADRLSLRLLQRGGGTRPGE
jgi:outer membrane murein-binding lipoprotein Lpp